MLAMVRVIGGELGSTPEVFIESALFVDYSPQFEEQLRGKSLPILILGNLLNVLQCLSANQ